MPNARVVLLEDRYIHHRPEIEILSAIGAEVIEARDAAMIRAAGLDVHEQEPVPANYPFFALDNVILSDHTGWYSEESQIELQSKVAHTIVEVLSGTLPTNVVNREAVARMRQAHGRSADSAQATA